ncbi:unnamed protein product, partial [Adineta steineri]
KLQDYHKKSSEYMNKTAAYTCLGANDLIQQQPRNNRQQATTA